MSLRDLLTSKFGARRAYWRARSGFGRIRFWFAKRNFGLRHSTHEASSGLSALPFLLRSGVGPVLWSLAVLAMCVAVDAPLGHLRRQLGWQPMEAASYDALLGAVAAVTGVFLALYFTAISTVAASVYMNVPHDIRALIVRDRLGTLYVSGVTFSMALAVGLLLVHVTAGHRFELAPIAASVLGLFSIFAFVALGQRAFYMADPTRLASTLAYEFSYWLGRAEAGGARWQDPNFQEHYRKQARSAVESLASLTRIAQVQSHLRGSSQLRLASAACSLLVRYLALRSRVPTKSLWFGQRYEHKQWYLTDSTEVELATRTSTQIRPRVVPDVTWVEDLLVPRLVALVEDSLREGEPEDAFALVLKLVPIWSSLGRQWSAGQIRRWTDALTERVLGQMRVAGARDRYGDSPEALALVDALASLPLMAELGFNESVLAWDGERLSARLRSIDGRSARNVYHLGLARPVLETLEQVHGGLSLESDIGCPSEVATQGWYSVEIGLASYERELSAQVAELVAVLSDWYPKTSKALFEAGYANAAAAVTARGLELVWKLEQHVGDWEQRARGLRPRSTLVDVPRPEWDWAGTVNRVGALRTALLASLAASIAAHAAQPQSDRAPDFLGAAVHFAGEACFDALKSANEPLLKSLFPAYLVGLLTITDRVRAQAAGWRQERAAVAVSEPLIDLMELSGCALIFSELHDKASIWGVCTTAWHGYLSGAQAQQRLQLLAAAHAYHRGLFMLTHRGALRARWEMEISATLQRLPRKHSEGRFGFAPVDHKSALIRAIAPSADHVPAMVHASDIFAVRFLRLLPGGAELDFGVARWVEGKLDGQREGTGEQGE